MMYDPYREIVSKNHKLMISYIKLRFEKGTMKYMFKIVGYIQPNRNNPTRGYAGITVGGERIMISKIGKNHYDVIYELEADMRAMFQPGHPSKLYDKVVDEYNRLISKQK